MPETYKPRCSLPELNAVPNKRLTKLPFWEWKLVKEGKSFIGAYTKADHSVLEVLITKIDKKSLFQLLSYKY